MKELLLNKKSKILEFTESKISSKDKLKGSLFKFPKVTATGSANLIMASVFIKGFHIIKNISIEPEVIDLINFLNNSGANIKFLGKRTIKITGVKELIKGNHNIIGDRIEAFSYLCVAAITGGRVTVKNINPKHLKTELSILKKIGYKIQDFKFYFTPNRIACKIFLFQFQFQSNTIDIMTICINKNPL